MMQYFAGETQHDVNLIADLAAVWLQVITNSILVVCFESAYKIIFRHR